MTLNCWLDVPSKTIMGIAMTVQMLTKIKMYVEQTVFLHKHPGQILVYLHNTTESLYIY